MMEVEDNNLQVISESARKIRIPFFPALLSLLLGMALAGELKLCFTFLIILLLFAIIFLIWRNKTALSVLALSAIFLVGAVNSHRAEAQYLYDDEEELPAAHYIDKTLPWKLSGFAKGILLNDRSELEENDIYFFRRSGITHLIAISGINIVLIAMPFWFAALKICKDQTLAGWITIASTIIYVWGIGAPSSALRAGIMIVILILAKMIKRRGNILNSLFGAAFLTLIFDPSALYDVGFQLSYAATYGLIVWTRRIQRFLPHRPRLIMELFAASTAAQVLTIPIMLWHFRELTLISFLTNIFAIPIFSMLLYLIIAALCHLPFAVTMSLFFFDALRKTAEIFSMLPGSSILVNRPPLIMLASIFAIAFLPLVNKRSLRIVLLLSLSVAAVIASNQKNEDGIYQVTDKYKHKGIIVVENGGAKIIDKGLSLKQWKDAISRTGAEYIEEAYIISVNGLNKNGFSGIFDYCAVYRVNVPENWKENNELNAMIRNIQHKGIIVEFRKKREVELIYNGKTLKLSNSKTLEL